MEERKQRWLKGSFTVEMAFLMPMILFLIMGCIRISFYYHDKNIIAGAAYETAVTGSTKVREKDGISESELNALFKERVGRKCILFSRIRVQSSVGKDEIKGSCKTKENGNICRKPCSGDGTGEIYPGYQKD